MSTFFSAFQLVSLMIFFLLFIGRTVEIRIQARINPIQLGVGKTGFRRFLELAFFVGLRTSMHVVQGRHALHGFDAGGLDVLNMTMDAFRERLRSENHTLKRALTDPRLFSGIGNAYSDEILHRACLWPILQTHKMTPEQIERLYSAIRTTLTEWIDRLRDETGDGFPESVTAFHPAMAVHGKFGQPCPVCGSTIQRIRYAHNETNYCPTCQTGGKLLADRALSRLLKWDWPRRPEELEERTQPGAR
ncbi:MAG: zinc finger domain-containing protein [candidate division KSB1 bacterium]|nr:zinc finger domain-containing protein [candidate division KSB1 bacterium]